jgi:hypothetical protein
MKTNTLAASAFLTLLATQTSYAENKLFPTDILDENQVDAQIGVNHDTGSRYVTSNGNFGSQRHATTTEEIGVRYGLGGHWQITADIPFDSENTTKTDYSKPVAHFVNTKYRGSQDPTFGVKYGFIDEPESAWSLSGRVAVSPNITNKYGTEYLATIAAGYKVSESLKYFAEINGGLLDRETNPDHIGVALGAYKDVYENITLIPHVSLTEFESTSTYSSYSQFDIGLASHIQIVKNTYLIPNATYFSNDSSDAKNGSFHASSSNGRAFNIELYHLF